MVNKYLVSTDKITALQKALGYKFRNESILIQALSHPSLRQHVSSNDDVTLDNERLELLGDSVIGFVITELIYKNFANYNEGKLATVKSHLVCKDMLCKIGLKINLNEAIIMTHGEEASGGRHNPNNIENAVEALMAAIYLDSDIETATCIIRELWGGFLSAPDLADIDVKSALQELVQSRGPFKPIYEVISKSGSAHAPIFVVEVEVQNHKQRGAGHSIKAAEKEAARKMLEVLRK